MEIFVIFLFLVLGGFCLYLSIDNKHLRRDLKHTKDTADYWRQEYAKTCAYADRLLTHLIKYELSAKEKWQEAEVLLKVE